jgi:hypothetical protein
MTVTETSDFDDFNEIDKICFTIAPDITCFSSSQVMQASLVVPIHFPTNQSFCIFRIPAAETRLQTP